MLLCIFRIDYYHTWYIYRITAQQEWLQQVQSHHWPHRRRVVAPAPWEGILGEKVHLRHVEEGLLVAHVAQHLRLIQKCIWRTFVARTSSFGVRYEVLKPVLAVCKSDTLYSLITLSSLGLLRTLLNIYTLYFRQNWISPREETG